MAEKDEKLLKEFLNKERGERKEYGKASKLCREIWKPKAK
jgi:hypothetical protein